ncbi:MAG: ArsI/CadI family heavy metal resistance metalloenzyme [Dokdonella sp.]
MKRMHIHVSVKDIDDSIRFYSGLFASEPTVRKDDYAKWLLDDPRVNFAISTRAQSVGINHLGIQAENAEELAEIEQRAALANLRAEPETSANCCYAQSNKHWLEDPQGIVWEAFHSFGEIPVYGSARNDEQACCPGPKNAAAAQKSAAHSSASCC